MWHWKERDQKFLVIAGLATKMFQSPKLSDQKILIVAELVIKIRFQSLIIMGAIQMLTIFFLCPYWWVSMWCLMQNGCITSILTTLESVWKEDMTTFHKRVFVYDPSLGPKFFQQVHVHNNMNPNLEIMMEKLQLLVSF
jgi:hypothetical protein